MYEKLLLMAIGIIIGLIISRFLPARLQINGKIKQKGRDTTNTIDDITTHFKTSKKEGILKRFKNKRLTKKQNK